jgi:hypothetical protein
MPAEARVQFVHLKSDWMPASAGMAGKTPRPEIQLELVSKPPLESNFRILSGKKMNRKDRGESEIS